jgi:Cupin domain
MKRVVTGVNERGRSYAVSIEEINTSSFDPVWSYEPGQVPEWLSAIDPQAAADWLGSQVPGGMRWMIVPFPPEKDIPEHPEYPGIDKDGYHTTRTIDFDCLLEGELTLVLEEGRIRLEPGDCVIQQATRHAWKNEGDKSALMIALLFRPESVLD